MGVVHSAPISDQIVIKTTASFKGRETELGVVCWDKEGELVTGFGPTDNALDVELHSILLVVRYIKDKGRKRLSLRSDSLLAITALQLASDLNYWIVVAIY